MQSKFTFAPMTSPLDSFGSFKDSYSVLIAGASTPDTILLDPHYGSEFRYRSLTKFWQLFPNETFFGHPRSWLIDEANLDNDSFVLRSKNIFAYIYVVPIERALVYINAPVDHFSYEQGGLADLMMGSLADAFINYKDLLKGMYFAKEIARIHILFFPSSLLKEKEDFNHLNHLLPIETKWKMDIAVLREGNSGIRIVYDDKILSNELLDAKNRLIQVSLLIDVLKKINVIFEDNSFFDIDKTLENEKEKKNRYRLFEVKRKVSFPPLTQYIVPSEKQHKLANKTIAYIANNNEITIGEFEGQDAKEKINQLITDLVRTIDERVEEFKFNSAIPFLISNIDSLADEFERKDIHVKNSLDQEVDYQREVLSGDNKLHFLLYQHCYRYLIEKFVQLKPEGENELSSEDIENFLALIERLLRFYSVSDYLHYSIYPATLIISHDFIVNINYSDDISEMQKNWSQERAKLSLGTIGNKNDFASLPFSDKEYIEEIDQSFKQDLGFSFKDMINLLQTLSVWARRDETAKEESCYKSDVKTISEFCTANIEDFEPSTTQKILDFLTLESEKILLVEGNSNIAPDLPVWEYRKRFTKYSLRPLVKIENEYYWGAYSVERAAKIWISMTGSHKLPVDINLPNTIQVLRKGHEAIEISLPGNVDEIVSRFTPFVETEVFPLKLGLCTEEIGDIDVFALSKGNNFVLNIESKIIDEAYCNKDLKRLSEKIFGRIDTKGNFKDGYLQKVEKRAKFLKDRGKEISEIYWEDLPDEPRVISLFVTPTSYWWTKNPPIETDVYFVEIKLLEDFLKNLENN